MSKYEEEARKIATRIVIGKKGDLFGFMSKSKKDALIDLEIPFAEFVLEEKAQSIRDFLRPRRI